VRARFKVRKSDGEAFEVVQWEEECDHHFRWNVPSMWDSMKVKILKVACRQNEVQ